MWTAQSRQFWARLSALEIRRFSTKGNGYAKDAIKDNVGMFLALGGDIQGYSASVHASQQEGESAGRVKGRRR